MSTLIAAEEPENDLEPGSNDPDIGTHEPQNTRPADGCRKEKIPCTREKERVGHVTIYRVLSKSPYWYLQYNLDAKQHRRSLGTTDKKKAKDLAKRKSAQLELGQAEPPDAKPIEVAQARQQYLVSLRSKGRSERSLAAYESQLGAFQAFCDEQHVKYLKHVTAPLLETYQTRLQTSGFVPPGRKGKRGRGFKAAANMSRTVRNKMKLVRQLIRWARKRSLLKFDPAASYELPKAVKVQAHCWTATELNAIRDHAPEGMLDIFDFLRQTGLRADELCWLTKDDLCADARPHLKIREKSCPLSGAKWRPKHGHERIVPLSLEALAIAKRAAAASPGPWLFYAPDTHGKQKGRWQRARIWKAVKTAMKAAGVSNGTTHTFRHVFCSCLARRNVSPFTIMKIMGHDSLDIVLMYCHTGEDELADAVAAVSFDAMLKTNDASGWKEVRN